MNDSTKINTPPKPASIFKRFVAHVIDGLLLSLIPIFFTALIGGFMTGLTQTSSEYVIVQQLLTGAISLLIYTLYFSILESSRSQASMGKKWLGLYVAQKIIKG